MEVRCGKCNKLFRVSDDKISGSGIKFACTRCSEYVKITREDFEQYALSKSAVSSLDMFEPKQKSTPATAAAPSPAPSGSLTPAPGPQPSGEPTAANGPMTQIVQPAAPAFSPPGQVLHQSTPQAESALHSREERTAREAPAAAPSRSGVKFLIFTAVFVLLGFVGYDVYNYNVSSAKKNQGPLLTSIEGLTITGAAGSIDANGDLLITGMVVNALDKERTDWYVIADVYNAQGAVLNKIGLLKGRQVYTRRDYEILARRGVNVQDLKASSLQQQGVVIPAKGSVTFEIRYVEPPVGIASFNETLQPFDPVQLYKEIAAEAQ